MAQAAEIQVTPEEARFLRRFFRRQTLPWMVGLGAVAVAAARFAVPPTDPEIERRLGESVAAIEALRAENAALLTRLEAVGQRMPAELERWLAAAEKRLAAVERRPNPVVREVPDAEARLRRLEERLVAADSAQDTFARSNLARLKELEGRLASVEGAAPALPAAPAP
jgi:phosphoglycolate phosphatase-like HAD superfamily hydrolase